MDKSGSDVTARRERLGMSIVELAQAAGISRDTLGDMETGRKDYRQTTLNKVLRALEAAEREAGLSAPDPAVTPESGLMEFEVSGDFGVRVIVRGPVADHATLAADVVKIIRDIRTTTSTEQDPTQPED